MLIAPDMLSQTLHNASKNISTMCILRGAAKNRNKSAASARATFRNLWCHSKHSCPLNIAIREMRQEETNRILTMHVRSLSKQEHAPVHARRTHDHTLRTHMRALRTRTHMLRNRMCAHPVITHACPTFTVT